MRYLFLFLGCLLFPVLGHAQSGEFEVIQVDPVASTFTIEANKQLRTYRVRPGAEVTINGVSASFSKLEVGMKVKVTSADPGVATKLVANGLQTGKPAAGKHAPADARGPIAPTGAPAKQAAAEIVASSAEGFSLGALKKGTKLSIQYKSGMWKSWGNLATESPDSEKTPAGDICRAVISLPAHNGQAGKELAVVPGETAKRPFIYEVPLDFPDLILRIKGKDGSFDGYRGKVEYTVSIYPPAK